MNRIPDKQVRIAMRHPQAADQLLLHVKNSQIPKDIQICWGQRRIPLSRGRHHGGYASLFPLQPVLRFESDLERKVLKHLASLPTCVALATQPVTVRFRFEGRARRYTPDVLAVFESVPPELASVGFGRFTFVEVKPLDSSEGHPLLWSARAGALDSALGMPLVRLPLQGGE